MRIVITGTPGVGKSKLAKFLAKKLKLKLFNEKEIAIKFNIGHFEEDELVIPIRKLEKKIKGILKKRKNVIIEGHMLCEMKLNVDLAIVITMDPEKLQEILEARGYGINKVLDNIFCEGIEYCKKHATRNYKNIIVLENKGDIKKLKKEALKAIEEWKKCKK